MLDGGGFSMELNLTLSRLLEWTGILGWGMVL
jgi:hypothetical protein